MTRDTSQNQPQTDINTDTAPTLLELLGWQPFFADQLDEDDEDYEDDEDSYYEEDWEYEDGESDEEDSDDKEQKDTKMCQYLNQFYYNIHLSFRKCHFL